MNKIGIGGIEKVVGWMDGWKNGGREGRKEMGGMDGWG